MIDIHTHILPLIDDGSNSLEDSLTMISDEIENGVDHIFMTPHALRGNIKPYTLEYLNDCFNNFKKYVEEKYPVKLYLGQEIYFRDDIISQIRKKEVLTMNGSNYIFVELPSVNILLAEIDEFIYSCDILGLKIIFAHIERYPYLYFDVLEKLLKKGVLFQVNASSLFSKNKNIKNIVSKLFKNNLVSFVASDIHYFRENSMKDAYEFVEQKYGKNLALDLFSNNAKQMFNIK